MTVTIRDEIRRRYRIARIVLFGGLAVVIGLRAFGRGMQTVTHTFLDRDQEIPFFAVLAIGVAALIAGFVLLARVKCPKCGRNLSAVAPGILGKSGKRVDFCPHCGVKLDEALPGRVIS